MFWFIATFMFPSMTCDAPALFSVKQPLVMYLPLNFAMYTVFLELLCEHFFLQTELLQETSLLELFLESSIFVSSESIQICLNAFKYTHR